MNTNDMDHDDMDGIVDLGCAQHETHGGGGPYLEVQLPDFGTGLDDD